MSLLTEKEKTIIKLHKEERNWNYIAQATHSSPNTIKKVIDKYEQAVAPKVKSIKSKALRMYDKNHTPYEVAVELDISGDDAIKFQLEFWRLKGTSKFAKICIEDEGLMSYILSKFQEIEKYNISWETLSRAVNLVNRIPQLQTECQNLIDGNEVLQKDCIQREEELSRARSEARIMRTAKRKMRNIINSMTQEKENLKVEIENLNYNLEKIKNSSDYKEISTTISRSISEAFGDKNMIL